jgi:hypothetical protein
MLALFSGRSQDKRSRLLRGRPNRILRLDGDDVIVATERSPAGTAAPIQMVQSQDS